MYTPLFILTNNEIEDTFMTNQITKKTQLKDHTIINTFENDFIGNIVEKTTDYYERIELEILCKYIPKNGVIYDIGANIGNHSLFFAKYTKPKKIFSFEPIQHVFEVLLKNIAENQLKNIEAFNFAVSDTNTTGKMLIKNNNVGASQLSLNEPGNIQVVKLDDLALSPPDFIKIDVEDLEYNVISGMEFILMKYQPIIWVEIRDSNFSRVHEKLKTLDYKLVDRVPNEYTYSNFLYMHKKTIQNQKIITDPLYTYHDELIQYKDKINAYAQMIVQLQQESQQKQELLNKASQLLSQYDADNQRLLTENQILQSQLKKY